MTLGARLARIERQTEPADRYAHLSDEELSSMLANLEARIEASFGMSLTDLAERVSEALHSGEPLPFELDEADARRFIASCPHKPMNLVHGGAR